MLRAVVRVRAPLAPSSLLCAARPLSAMAAPPAPRRATPLDAILAAELAAMQEAGTYKRERVITSPQAARVTTAATGAGAPLLNFCANNYLGLSSHPRVVAAAHAALDSHGFGLSSVRFICGTQDVHKRLEAAIAAFHGTEDAILFPSCFDANAGTFEALLGKEDAVISDELNHASIIDGIRLCKAERRRYKHCDVRDLEAQLVAAAGARVKMIVTDGVFSMDGDVAPLAAICDLADKHGAVVFVDECHATGFFGATGRGTDEHCGVRGRVDIINSTLGKALGGATGGYTAAPRAVVDVLRQRARPYLFSNSVAPAVVGASLEVFKMIAEDASYVQRVRGLTHRFRSALSGAGFSLRGAFDHPIVPVMLGDARLAAEFAEAMLARGVYVVGFSYPVVPKGAARIRTQISAAHSEADVDAAAAAFIAVGREKGVIPPAAATA